MYKNTQFHPQRIMFSPQMINQQQPYQNPINPNQNSKDATIHQLV